MKHRFKRMSLRLRLLLTLVLLVFAGLVVADAALYVSLRSFLLDRIDQQLTGATIPVSQVLQYGNLGNLGINQQNATTALPPGTYGCVLDSSGKLAQSSSSQGPAEKFFTYGTVTFARPLLPSTVVKMAARSPSGVMFTTHASGDPSRRYRVLATQLQPPDQAFTLVVAIPLSEMAQTLGRLVGIEVVVTLGVLVALAGIGGYLIRRELRPLADMAATADAIAAGDLSRRVDYTEPETEVGRLGMAFNAMLVQIERAFDRRTQSEDKLRRFLAQASHELRTPLVSIRGYAELFRRGAKERPEDLELAMRRIEQEATRMGVLVDELLQVARRDEERPLERSPVDLAHVAGDAVADARTVAPERAIELSSPASVVVSGDEAGLRQLVANLVVNALQHAGDGATIQVAVRQDDGHALLEVADDGVGMSEDDAERIFEPFYRTEQSRAEGQGSTGLGLSIVAAIAEAHGGCVDLRTAPGEGSCFTVTLPLSAPA